MTRHNLPLGMIRGIPIGLDYAWFVIFALLTLELAAPASRSRLFLWLQRAA
jgi:hypothetical protein